MITRRLLFRQAAEQNSDAFSLTQEWYLFHVPLGARAGPAPVPPLARSLLRLLRLCISVVVTRERLSAERSRDTTPGTSFLGRGGELRRTLPYVKKAYVVHTQFYPLWLSMST